MDIIMKAYNQHGDLVSEYQIPFGEDFIWFLKNHIVNDTHGLYFHAPIRIVFEWVKTEKEE